MSTSDASGEVAAELEPLLLGGAPQLSWDQFVEAVGLPADRIRRIWVALGFPLAQDPNDPTFTDADVHAVRGFDGLVQDGIVPDQLQVAVARTLGQTMARLAEWQVDVVLARARAEHDGAADDFASSDPQARAEEIARKAVPALEDLQEYAWRRHLSAAARRAFDGGEPDPASRRLVVGFADMVGYTRLTRHLDADELAELLESFESSTTEIVTAGNGWVIKNVGDEVMYACDDPADAARIGLELQARAERDANLPELRVGMAYGPVLTRFGDLYGSVVNIAARLTGVARPGTVLIDTTLFDAIEDDPELAFRHLRAVRVRGFSRLRAHVLRSTHR